MHVEPAFTASSEEGALDWSTENSGFAAGTLVHTKEGPKPIEDVRIDDWVLCYPDDQVPPPRLREQAEYVYRQVTATAGYDDQPVCEVIAWDMGNNIKESIKVTPNHPVFIKGAGWGQAGGLKFGNALLTSEFANLMMKKRLETGQRMRVYDIEVDGFGTYYVGNLGIWVHGK